MIICKIILGICFISIILTMNKVYIHTKRKVPLQRSDFSINGQEVGYQTLKSRHEVTCKHVQHDSANIIYRTTSNST